MSENRFVELASINVNKHIEKKNGLSYLSWAWALDQLMRLDPEASWEYPEPRMFGATMMVYCTVTAFGKAKTAHLPVMDHRNKPIANPDAFAVNTAMQRCLVKAIALHGLGLYIYAGEDLPLSDEKGDEEPAKPISLPRPITARQTAEDAFEALDEETQSHLRDVAMDAISRFEESHAPATILQFLDDLGLESEHRLAMWSLLPSKLRSALKKAREEQTHQKEAA